MMLRLFGRYTLVGLASRSFQVAFAWLTIDRLGVNTILAVILAGAIVHMVAFAVHVTWTFKNGERSEYVHPPWLRPKFRAQKVDRGERDGEAFVAPGEQE